MFNDDEMNTSDCSRTREQLGRFHDGELDADEGTRVGKHLRHCRHCTHDLEQLRSVESLLGVGCPDGDLERRLVEVIRRRRASGWWIRAAAAAVLPLALGAIGGGLLFNGRAEQGREGSTSASLIEESFGPGSLHGFDDLARDLEPRGRADQ